MQRLYVLIDNNLDSIYGCVQGGHVVAQWLLNHPNQDWNNSYLIYVSADISKWKEKLDILEIDYTEFREPDLNNCDFDENGRLKLVPITFEENALAKGIS